MQLVNSYWPSCTDNPFEDLLNTFDLFLGLLKHSLESLRVNIYNTVWKLFKYLWDLIRCPVVLANVTDCFDLQIYPKEPSRLGQFTFLAEFASL